MNHDDSTLTPARAAIDRLLGRIDQSVALAIRPEAAALVHHAAGRVAALLDGGQDDVLTIALAGGSGVGKSTLINALAGATIAEAAEQRPCTMRPTIYHHRDVPGGGLPSELTAAARTVVHERPELRFKVILDTPDLDTFATQNRAATRAVLKASGLVIYVFSPEKYWEERAWTVIRDERRFSASLAVLNKSDTVAPHELEKAADEIRRRFAELGVADMPVLRVCAARHIPRPDGSLPPDAPTIIDEFPSLRAEIEREWRDGDIARMRRDQRLRVLDHLDDAVAAAVPADLAARLDALDSEARAAAETEADRLAVALEPALAAAELELRPQARLRQHRRFFGPFRAWLAVGDLVTITLPRLARRVRGLGGGTVQDLEELLAGAPAEALDDSLHAWSDHLRDLIYHAGLPVDRWRQDSESPPLEPLLAELAREVRARHGLLDARPSLRLGWVARIASGIGWAIPMVLSAYALYSLVGHLLAGRLTGGFDLLALVLTVTILSFTLLNGLTALALAGRVPAAADVGRQSIRAVLRRYQGQTLGAYRGAIESDLRAIRQPLETLRTLALTPPELAPVATLRATAAVPVLDPPVHLGRSSGGESTAATSADWVEPRLELADPGEDRESVAPVPAKPIIVAAPTVAAANFKPEPESGPETEASALSPAEIFRQAVRRRSLGKP